MKLMILSMFAALALSDSVTNVVHENTPRLIQTNRRLLTENCPTIDECEPQHDGTFAKYTCNNIDKLVRKEYSNEPCDSTTKLSGTIKSQSNDPCCVNNYICPQEEKDSVGICEYIGERAFPPGDPNHQMLSAYQMRFCRQDGSGGLTIRANDCDIQSPLYSSSIQVDDPCCEPSTPSCDKELGTCVYNAFSGYSSKLYCDGDGGLIYTSWDGSDCSDPAKVVMSSWSSIRSGDPCCPAKCDKKLGQCVHNVATGYSNKYYCGKGLIYASWKGVSDCSDPNQVAMSSVTDDPICCPV